MIVKYMHQDRPRLLIAVTPFSSFASDKFVVTALPSNGGCYSGMKPTYEAGVAAAVAFLIERGELDGLFDAFFGWLQ